MSDDEDVPSLKVCEERIAKFVEITGTDEAFAQMSLQDQSWDLEKAIKAFLDQQVLA